MGQYKVVYNSVMLAMDRQEVEQAFARLFNIPPEKAAAILARPKTVLRSGLDARAAEGYREKLMAIGIDVDLVDTTQPKPKPVQAVELAVARASDLSVVPVEEKPADAQPELPRFHGNHTVGFDFDGTGSEYFRIWIVNVLFTVLTLGIYSAWAKVRTQQYFYGNTQLDGSSFQYLANPLQILKGRLIGVALLAIYFGSQQFSVTAGLVALAALLLLSPALLVLGLTARFRFTAWRHITFNFDRDFRDAYLLMALPLLVVGLVLAISEGTELAGLPRTGMTAVMGTAMTIWLVLLPYWLFAFTRFIVSHARYGNTAFVFSASPWQYYLLCYIKMPLVFIGAMLVVVVLAMVFGTEDLAALQRTLEMAQSGAEPAWEDASRHALLPALLGVVTMLAYLIGISYFQAQQFNLRYHSMALGKSYLSCNVRAWPLLWLWVSNTIAIVLTAGLFIPWAKVRMVRYRLSCLQAYISYDLGDIIAEGRRGNAVGQEVSDLFDIDIAL